MRFVIQCVDNAEVEINGSVVGKIGKGYLVLAGIGESDTCDTADRMIEKMLKLRIFEDENGKTKQVHLSTRKNSITIWSPNANS